MTVVTEAGQTLSGARVYLSGPMDFVKDRNLEAKFGWRTRVSEFLSRMGVIIFDPWNKPDVRWFHEYGKEDDGGQDEVNRRWTYDQSSAGERERAWCSERFWQTHHIDLRMVDTTDFVIAYCPTTIYSVGTVNEIVVARLEFKPVLLVTPHIPIPEIDALRDHLKNDSRGQELLEKLERRIPIKSNLRAIPSKWYMPLVGGHNFFDGFGFDKFRGEFGWEKGPLDENEKDISPLRPLLPFLRELNDGKKPQRYDLKLEKNVDDDHWLVWDLGQRRSDAV